MIGAMVGKGVGTLGEAGAGAFVNENGIDAAGLFMLEGADGVFTEEIEPRAGTGDAGAARRGAAGCTGFAFPTEIESSCPGESNGLVISDGTSICL